MLPVRTLPPIPYTDSDTSGTSRRPSSTRKKGASEGQLPVPGRGTFRLVASGMEGSCRIRCTATGLLTVYGIRMARPLTKGRPISLRLPINADAEVRARAESRGVSAAAWIAAAIARAVEPKTSPPQPRRQSNSSTMQETADDCRHAKAMPIAGGLKRCPECQAVRGMDGLWRHGAPG
jgi:hypothetical protein